jgi:outer membrane receptor for ferric coprogen and ferric-rhodotorulic acid
MKNTVTRSPRPAIALATLLALLATPLGRMQTTTPAAAAPKPAPAATPAEKKTDDTVLLDPFEVKTDRDTSYGALNSNSIVRFNVELEKAPMAADIFTQQFMEDTQVRSVEELFDNYAGGAGRAFATVESDSNATQPGDRFSSDQYGVRGVAAGVPRRDGFPTTRTQQNATSLFDTERLEVVHGSQGLLYGATGPGGVVNIVSKQARFNQTTLKLSERMDQYGSRRSMLDANYGTSKAAIRISAIHDANQTRRLFIGDKTDGIYGQAAFKLPFNTILRLNAEETHNHRILPNNLSVSFPSALNDPRSGRSLTYLIATGQQGAINPATGQPFPGGALVNGNLSERNAQSFLGWHSEDDTDVRQGGAFLDTVWTKWLSTSFAAVTYKKYGDRDPNGATMLAPPYTVNGAIVTTTNNPLNDWAVAPSLTDSSSSSRVKNYRASVLLTNDLFRGRAHSQTVIGFDRSYQDDTGGVNYAYYLANPDGTITTDITKTNMGRTQLTAQAWGVGNGPIKTPLIKSAAGSITVNGQTYVRMLTNPRSKDWITPNNPLGLASLYAASLNKSTNTNGISGGNASGFENESRDQGYFVANYTNWFGDRLQTLFGFRRSDAFTRNPNTTAALTSPYIEDREGPFPSYNAGIVYRLMRLPGEGTLRGYYGYSRTWNASNGSNDAYGNLPQNPTGMTHEFGLKFSAYQNRISGSVSAFMVDSKHENYSAGSTYRDTVNPTGLNGAYVSSQGSKNNWAAYDKSSRGVELLLNGQITKHWGGRAAISISDGTVKSDSIYPMLYNDQFYQDKSGTVTYGNGQPFLVPDPTAADAQTTAALAGLKTLTTKIDPTKTAPYTSAKMVPLTTEMINDPNNPYHAFGQGTAPANQPVNGAIGTGTLGSGGNILKTVLTDFQAGGQTALTGATGLPVSARQYAFADPAGYKGVYVVQRKGDATVGYPVFRLNLTTFYDVQDGWLKGLRPGGSIAFSAWNRTYWFAIPDRSRHLYSASLENPTVNLWLSYSRKFRKVRWSTQVNVNNVFNHYQINFTPNNGTGYTNPSNVGISYSGEPRLWVWSNTVSF